MPERYSEIDFRQLYQLKDKYPKIYKKVEKRLETGWENTISLLEQGMEQGVIRKVHIPIVKMMLESTLEQFFQRDVLVKNKISYQEALDEVVDIMMDGIFMYDKDENSIKNQYVKRRRCMGKRIYFNENWKFTEEFDEALLVNADYDEKQ